MNANGLYKSKGRHVVREEPVVLALPSFLEVRYGALPKDKLPCELPCLLDEHYNEQNSYRHHLDNINSE